jgi:hypothetical protein
MILVGRSHAFIRCSRLVLSMIANIDVSDTVSHTL